MVISKLLRTVLLFIMLQFVFSNSIYCQTKNDSIYKKIIEINVDSTTWTGVDSDGDYYEFTFLKDGKVSYKTNTSRSDTVQFNDEEDVWFQNGSVIVILLGNTSVRKGIITNNKMEGDAWNVDGRGWTWVVKRK